MTEKFVSQAEFARRHNVSRKTVTMWKKSGLIVMTGGTVNLEASDKRLQQRCREKDGRTRRGPASCSALEIAAHEIERRATPEELFALYAKLRRDRDVIMAKALERASLLTAAMEEIEAHAQLAAKPMTMERIWRVGIADGYAASLLRAQGVKSPDGNLISLKRDQLRVHRLARELKQVVTETKEES